MLLKGAKDTDAFGSRKNEGKAVEDVVITFTPGLSEKGEDLLSRKKEREHKKDRSVWEQYQDKRAEKRKEKGRRKEAARKAAQGGGDEDQPFSDDEVPDGVAVAGADDAAFDDDFFKLPDEGSGEEGADQEVGGMFKKNRKGRKGDPGATAARKNKKMAEEEEERRRKQQQQLELLMMDDKDTAAQRKAGFSLKHGALGRASQQAGSEVQDAAGKKRKKKGKKGKEDDQDGEDPAEGGQFEVNVHDERFASVFSDPRFALDPTDPQFRKTPGLSKLLDEGRHRRALKRGREDPGEGAGDSVGQNLAGGESGGRQGGGRPLEHSGGTSGKKGKFKDAQLASLVSTLKARSRH